MGMFLVNIISFMKTIVFTMVDLKFYARRAIQKENLNFNKGVGYNTE